MVPWWYYAARGHKKGNTKHALLTEMSNIELCALFALFRQYNGNNRIVTNA